VRGRLARLAQAALGGLATTLAFPLVIPQLSLRQLVPGGGLEWIAWISLVPVILAVEAAAGPGEAALLGLVAGLATFYSAIYWVSHAMTAFGGLSTGVAFVGLSALVLYMAAHWMVAFWASFLVRRRLGVATWIQLPVLWVATELSRNYLFTGFPWANLGYNQVRHLHVAQLAALGGCTRWRGWWCW
jgi:apolipoprotein N-acyltransferase